MSQLRHLSADQLAAYERDGFLVLENFASPEQIQRLKAHIRTILDKTDPTTIGGIFATGNKQLVRTIIRLSRFPCLVLI
jgi:hypothetical protein